jgi:hypothetical protein
MSSRKAVRVLALVCACVVAWGESSRLLAMLCPVSYGIGPVRGAAAIVTGGPYYDYSPSTMKDGSLYKMWWCGGIAGDFILYSESYSLDSGWSPYQIALMPSSQPGAFDSLLTCDPSVVRVNGTYYLYYGGAGGAQPGHAGTAIFLATSTNGINFTRANNGQPIVSPAQSDPPGPQAEYGAGQPTVTYVNGWFYMRYTDSTGLGNPLPDNPADAQYMIRSQDPTFQSGTEAFRGPGVFTASNQSNHTLNRFWPEHYAGLSAEMIYIDATDQFAFPGSEPGPTGNTKVEVYNSSFSRKEGEFYIPFAANSGEEWYDAPTFVSTPDRHALTTGTCGVLALDIMRSYGPTGNFYGSGIAHVGADWYTGLTCDCVSAPTLNQPGYCAVGDFNGDNRDDLTSHHRPTGPFSIRANNGAGGFAPDGVFTATGSTPPSGWGYETLIGDFDGDNWTDYADRHIASGQVWVHRNLHNGTFDGNTWAFGYTMTGPNIEILVGDLSGDGKADLIEHNRKTGQLWVRRNTGAGGTFEPENVYITHRSQVGSLGHEWRLIAADFDGNGVVDIADFHIPSSQFWVHPAVNIGSYQFAGWSWNPVQSFLWGGFTTVFGDFDGDGWADYGDVNIPFGDIWVHRSQNNGLFDPNTYAYGVYSLGSGGRSILGVPVNFP